MWSHGLAGEKESGYAGLDAVVETCQRYDRLA